MSVHNRSSFGRSPLIVLGLNDAAAGSLEQGTMASVTHGSTRNLRRADLVSARDT